MCQLQNLETVVRPYLSQWYEESVMHIHRVVQLVQNNISFLLHAVSHFSPLDYIITQILCVCKTYMFSRSMRFCHYIFCVQALSHTHVEVSNSDERTKADVSR